MLFDKIVTVSIGRLSLAWARGRDNTRSEDTVVVYTKKYIIYFYKIRKIKLSNTIKLNSLCSLSSSLLKYRNVNVIDLKNNKIGLFLLKNTSFQPVKICIYVI